jgi:DNA-binding beta-propeller fold protein YncE
MRNFFAPEVDYDAPQQVRDAVASLGRTEDVKFSPSNRRLAVAGFGENKIAVFDVSIAASTPAKNIALTGVAEISSSHLNQPHGVDFIDDETIVVANRYGQPCVFRLPVGATGRHELEPLVVIESDDISSPGSVAVISNGRGPSEALICNNYVHTVTKHRLDLNEARSIKNEILLGKWLDIPDSICVSKDRQWIAVSNHNSHAIFLYENNPTLDASCRPDGILRGYYPHGVRFTSDGQFIFGASAGSPFVNVYEAGTAGWRGVRSPLMSFRVLDAEDFTRGQDGRRADGGAKGIDIDNATNVLVTTCEMRPLAFFDLTTVLESASGLQRKANHGANSTALPPKGWLRIRHAAQIGYDLYVRQRAEAAARWILAKVPPLNRLRTRITGLS